MDSKWIEDIKDVFLKQFPESKLKIEMFVSSYVIKHLRLTHGVVVITYTIGEKTTEFIYTRISYESIVLNHQKVEDIEIEIYDKLRFAFLNVLIYGIGPMSIHSILSGESEPIESSIRQKYGHVAEWLGGGLQNP